MDTRGCHVSISSWKTMCCGRQIEIERIISDILPLMRIVTCRLLVDRVKIKESTKSGLILLNPLGSGESIATMIQGNDGKQHLIEVHFPGTWACAVRLFVDGELVDEAG
jgi:hypothetical protein